jgi:hypothetical protein
MLRNRMRSLISANNVRAMSTPMVVGGDRDEHGETTVELVREGGDVVAIHVTCRCGEEIVLECELAADGR